ncbi:MAG: PepSY-like domain-containing protein [Bacteroidota bacterium]
MKTIIFFILLCFTFSGYAQKSKSKKVEQDTLKSTTTTGVPDKLMEKFRKEYPSAIEARWSKEPNDEYKVIFKDPPNTLQLIIYDKNWKVIRKETELDSKQIPDTIINYYKQNYPQETGYRVWLNEDASGRTYYSNGTEFGIFFDLNGRVIKRVPVPVIK